LAEGGQPDKHPQNECCLTTTMARNNALIKSFLKRMGQLLVACGVHNIPRFPGTQ